METLTDDRARRLAAGQGAFWIASGLWPVVHLPSFEAVTGRKRDKWLVRTVGLLIASIGGGLLAAARRRRVTPEVAGIAAGSALALTGIDVWYVARRVIRPVYLADAAIEFLIAAAWGSAALSGAPRAGAR